MVQNVNVDRPVDKPIVCGRVRCFWSDVHYKKAKGISLKLNDKRNACSNVVGREKIVFKHGIARVGKRSSQNQTGNVRTKRLVKDEITLFFHFKTKNNL
jgi:hypothetical protein